MKELEIVRQAGTIGSSLQAEVDDRRAGADYAALASLGDDLRFVMITSAARVDARATRSTIAVDAERACRSASAAGTGAPTSAPIRRTRRLCGRCVANLFGSGEPRRFA